MKGNSLLALLLAASLVLVLSGCTITDNRETPPPAPTSSESAATPSAPVDPTPDASVEPTPTPDPSTVSVDMELSSGNYTAGVDFPGGKYDLVAVSGGGNVSSSNAYSGGINAVMGTEDKNEIADMYEQEYSNIKLPAGTVLSISGVTIRITCDAADGAPLTPRNQGITETVDLGNGNFVAGEDFPSGVYNIVATSGGGNVSSSNIFGGGINAVMGTADKNEIMDMYEQEYKNIDLPDGTTISVDGVKIQLIPST